ncbi:ATP-NAD kinase family protein [Thalassotalea ponticola]|uniref:ATP-NAD kinase family protein n=1 Tax=Thalassotalea ponticola TaxID=1523392 RepID=UPI0025B2BFE9|nr:ATP-NAD kinase family protein [Thalassotalea ponticola]MDN3653906.1 ATP-NAD kinase family protein [Thalassotalea ponticola]
MSTQFKLGFLINPVAGIGGSVGLKGSDGKDTPQKAIALGAEPKANLRAKLALEVLLPYKEQLIIYTAAGDMGQLCAEQLGFNTQVVYHPTHPETTAEDTERVVQVLQQVGVDLLLFAGGDGTARNVCHQVDGYFPVLGIPAGCKIHSGVYALTPTAAGRVVEQMLNNQLVSFTDADVMDIDEQAFRSGVVKARRYGEMQIPSQLQYIQAVKSGGKESDELVLMDIAADVIEQMEDQLFIIGSGSTVGAVMAELALDNTLLGVDLVQHQELIASDVIESQIMQAIERATDGVKLVITVIGGQGHIFGRGNQQLSPRVIRAIGKENIIIIATKRKLQSLQQRPLIVDTGDRDLDSELSGYLPVITGFHDQVLYPVASPGLD